MIKPTNAITKDTDNLTLLLHYCQPAAQVLYMTSSQTTISINSIKLLVPQVIIKTPIPEQDVTQHLHLKVLENARFCQKSPVYIQEIAEVFMSEGVSKEEIIKRGEESLLILFGSDAKA